MSLKTKPFLKWVGGKSQIMDLVLSKFPKDINNYYEPFVGGGSVLFSLLDSDIKCKKIYVYDINVPLIYCYKNIQETPELFITETLRLVNSYNEITVKNGLKKPETLEDSVSSKESYYYHIRKLFNDLQDKKTVEASAMFLFLNKTCFRGLYREGPNGFNVPFGNYVGPSVITPDEIMKISLLIRDVSFEVSDFTRTLSNKFNKDDFIYMDPPYAKIDDKSFVSYAKDGFNNDANKLLFTMTKSLVCKFVMSNADVPLIHEEFKDYSIDVIRDVKRRINSKDPESTVNEVMINNFTKV